MFFHLRLENKLRLTKRLISTLSKLNRMNVLRWFNVMADRDKCDIQYEDFVLISASAKSEKDILDTIAQPDEDEGYLFSGIVPAAPARLPYIVQLST